MKPVALQHVVSLIKHLPCSLATLGVGSFIHLEFGSLYEFKRRNGAIGHKGESELFIYLCDWDIADGSKTLVGSEEISPENEAILEVFLGKSLTQIRRTSANEIEAVFSNNIRIVMRQGDYDDIDDYFMLYTRDYILSFSPATGFSVEQRNPE